MKEYLATIRNRARYSFRSPYGTHAPFLRSALQYLINSGDFPDGGVLFEIGTGGKSSQIFQDFLNRHSEFSLVSFENDSIWQEKYRKEYPERANFKLVDIKDDWNWEKAIIQRVSMLREHELALVFIDSNPWQSRASSLSIVKNLAQIVLVHDVDFFPKNNFFGTEESPIIYRPRSPILYGSLQEKFLGRRDYGEVFTSWVEAFPTRPAYFTGPPTLIGSNLIDVKKIPFHKGSIRLTSSH